MPPARRRSPARRRALDPGRLLLDRLCLRRHEGRALRGDRPGPSDQRLRTLEARGRSAIRAANPRHLILRTSWVYSAHGATFSAPCWRAAKSGRGPRRRRSVGLSDGGGRSRGCGRRRPARGSRSDGPSGTYHPRRRHGRTWHGFAEAIFARLAARGLKRAGERADRDGGLSDARRRGLETAGCRASASRDFGVTAAGLSMRACRRARRGARRGPGGANA